jgi:hypothetical protein
MIYNDKRKLMQKLFPFLVWGLCDWFIEMVYTYLMRSLWIRINQENGKYQMAF